MNRRDVLKEKVKEKGRQLRAMSPEEIRRAGDLADDHFLIEGRKASIAAWTEEVDSDLIVIVRGHLPRLLGCTDALDGFRLDKTGQMIDLTQRELDDWW